MRARLLRAAGIASLVFATAACGGTATNATPNGAATLPYSRRASSSSAIQHVVIVIQENRTFDNLFATFPNADGTTQGRMKLPSGGYSYIPLQKSNLVEPCDFGHSYRGYRKDYDNGAMDGFNLEGGGKPCPGPTGTKTYQYVNRAQIAPYWAIAKSWVLADHMFQTQGSGSFTAHQDLIRGGTLIEAGRKSKTLVDFPSAMPWGCDAPKYTKTSILVSKGVDELSHYRRHDGPFPCLTYPTLRDLLDSKGVTWKYYSPPEPRGTGKLWSAFDAIQAVREGPEWATNVVPTTQFFSDVQYGQLAGLSWIVPDLFNSDHPATAYDYGPSWVASIVNAIGESAYWNSTAVIVVWDDWGGFYDHVAPPLQDQSGGLGFRVPMLLVSPYARKASPKHPGYVSHTQYEFGSIIKFVEDTWNLGSLGTTDVRATSIVDSLDFSQSPRPFHPIPSERSRVFFEHQRPSYQPVDTE
ncbi:MAG: hypothetical protein JOZ77_09085 [Candidatus Eremiobacteraeota bacterium]|nr:hypothetical protein [Candidatus Eremiobacteraeota bacterium]